MKNFRTYLQELGLSDIQGEERKAMYKSYKREYLRGYMKHKRSSHQVIEIFFTKQDYQQLNQRALSQGLSCTAFVEDVILQAIDKKIWIPNAEIIAELQVSIRKIGNNINQIARISNYEKTGAPELWEQTNQRFSALEQYIHNQLAHPELFGEV